MATLNRDPAFYSRRLGMVCYDLDENAKLQPCWACDPNVDDPNQLLESLPAPSGIGTTAVAIDGDYVIVATSYRTFSPRVTLLVVYSLSDCEPVAAWNLTSIVHSDYSETVSMVVDDGIAYLSFAADNFQPRVAAFDYLAGSVEWTASKTSGFDGYARLLGIADGKLVASVPGGLRFWTLEITNGSDVQYLTLNPGGEARVGSAWLLLGSNIYLPIHRGGFNQPWDGYGNPIATATANFGVLDLDGHAIPASALAATESSSLISTAPAAGSSTIDAMTYHAATGRLCWVTQLPRFYNVDIGGGEVNAFNLPNTRSAAVLGVTHASPPLIVDSEDNLWYGGTGNTTAWPHPTSRGFYGMTTTEPLSWYHSGTVARGLNALGTVTGFGIGASSCFLATAGTKLVVGFRESVSGGPLQHVIGVP